MKDAGLPADKEQAALRLLLHKETKLLQTIDRWGWGGVQVEACRRSHGVMCVSTAWGWADWLLA